MNKRIKIASLLSLAVGFLLIGAIAEAQVPQLMNYQGVLKDGGGSPITGTRSIVFSIYDTPTGGTPLWSETQGSVNVAGGLFNVLLGSTTALPAGLFYGTYAPASSGDRYLGVKVGTDPEMTPRQRLVSVSNALKAGDADTLGDGLVVADKQNESVVFGPDGQGAEVTMQREYTTPASTNLVTNYTAYGDPARLTARRADGTITAPSAVQSGQPIGNVQFRGYDGTAFSSNGNAAITARASENFTPTNQGTELYLVTTPNGTANPKVQVFVGNDGKVGIGTITPSQQLEVVGNVRANSFINTSTRALKKDIVPLAQRDYQDILKQIDGIQLVHYLYKTESNRRPHLGVIAEDSPKEILDPTGKAVSLYDYASFLMAGLKAQSEQISVLTEKIKALEAQQANRAADEAGSEVRHIPHTRRAGGFVEVRSVSAGRDKM